MAECKRTLTPLAALLLLLCSCFNFAGTATAMQPDYSGSSRSNPPARHIPAVATEGGGQRAGQRGSLAQQTLATSDIPSPYPADSKSSRGALRLGASPANDVLPNSEATLHAVEPFVIGGADVVGQVSNELQTALRYDPWAAHRNARPTDDFVPGHRDGAQVSRGRRGLLHGTRPAWKYAICNRCTIVSCNVGRTSCSGHCKKNNKAFFCSRNNIPTSICITPPGGIVRPDSPDALATYNTVIVTAPTPYVGCANIANRPTGCPAPFTGGTTSDGNRITVVQSSCIAEGYTPECGSPYYPFGVCECKMIVSGVGVVTRPCDTREVTLGVRSAPNGLPTAGLPSTSEDGVTVDSRGRVTYTGFSDYTDEEDEPRWQYNVTVAAGDAAAGELELVTVFLDFFQTDVIDAEELTEEGDISEDYDYGEFVP